eukprot:m.469689 g.469689  ORF g.469689 m.469689 type:complete len:106 (-) comp28950_c0_seq1:40-357(-)
MENNQDKFAILWFTSQTCKTKSNGRNGHNNCFNKTLTVDKRMISADLGCGRQTSLANLACGVDVRRGYVTTVRIQPEGIQRSPVLTTIVVPAKLISLHQRGTSPP